VPIYNWHPNAKFMLIDLGHTITTLLVKRRNLKITKKENS
jgi:hypothetical protein